MWSNVSAMKSENLAVKLAHHLSLKKLAVRGATTNGEGEPTDDTSASSEEMINDRV